MPGMVPRRLAALRLAGDRNAGEQPARVGMARRSKNFCRRAGLHHLASVHDDDARGDARDDAEIMRDEHQPHMEFALQLGEQMQDLRLDRHVERGGRLVGDDQIGPAHQRHGDHDALAQAARELVRVLAQALACRRDADALEQMDGTLARLADAARGDGAATPLRAGCRWCRRD